jgi:hypothetical protein
MRQFGLRCPGFNAHDFYIDLNVVFDHDPYSFDSQIEIAHKRQLIISQYSMDFQYSGVLFACSIPMILGSQSRCAGIRTGRVH